ncbi:MAG: hypothetical protein ACKO2G_15625 [Verrucomicrobiales bacterium]
MKRKTLLLLLALPPVLLLLVDVGLRFIAPPGDFPELKTKFVNDLPGLKREVSWTSGPDGLRKVGWEDGRPRVLCFGGENATPVLQADSDTWWGVAAASLAADGLPVAIGSISNSGQPASMELGWIRHFAGKMKPKVVVLSFGAGEVLSRPAGYRYEENANPAELSFLPTGWKGTVLKTSTLASYWRLSRQKKITETRQLPFSQENALKDRFTLECNDWQKAPMISEIPWMDDPSDEVAATVKKFAAMGKEMGFRPIVLWEPWPHRPDMTPATTSTFRRLSLIQSDGKVVPVRADPAWVDHRMRAFHTRARAVCEGMGIEFVDAAASLNGQEGVFLDDTLFTDAGARAVGTILAPVLKRLLQSP